MISRDKANGSRNGTILTQRLGSGPVACYLIIVVIWLALAYFADTKGLIEEQFAQAVQNNGAMAWRVGHFALEADFLLWESLPWEFTNINASIIISTALSQL